MAEGLERVLAQVRELGQAEEQELAAGEISVPVAGESRSEGNEANRVASSPASVPRNSSDDNPVVHRASTHGDIHHMGSQGHEGPWRDPFAAALGCASVAGEVHGVDGVDLGQGEKGNHVETEGGSHTEAHHKGWVGRPQAS